MEMACKTYRDISAEQAARKLVLAGQPDATAAERLAALRARMEARTAAISNGTLAEGARMLRDALQEDDDRGRYIHIR